MDKMLTDLFIGLFIYFAALGLDLCLMHTQ